ncbi:hypothetical protein [Ruegeria hyattellae]|uniref:hypothetical protein n=1 Tax=Ruegeria hyattellae TaxID=3233337 RepID=UPI00355BAA83
MKTLIRIALFGMMLAGCGPLSLYYQPGVSVTRQQNDTTRCEVQALEEVPVNTQIRQAPPVYYPGDRYCNRGQCWRGNSYWAPGPVYSVDANKTLRAKVLDLCMADKGYQPVSIPACSQSVKSQVPPGRTTTLPQLSSNSCFVRNDDRSYQIVTPQIASTGG